MPVLCKWKMEESQEGSNRCIFWTWIHSLLNYAPLNLRQLEHSRRRRASAVAPCLFNMEILSTHFLHIFTPLKQCLYDYESWLLEFSGFQQEHSTRSLNIHFLLQRSRSFSRFERKVEKIESWKLLKPFG
jgi:hypothetical protein